MSASVQPGEMEQVSSGAEEKKREREKELLTKCARGRRNPRGGNCDAIIMR